MPLCMPQTRACPISDCPSPGIRPKKTPQRGVFCIPSAKTLGKLGPITWTQRLGQLEQQRLLRGQQERQRQQQLGLQEQLQVQRLQQREQLQVQRLLLFYRKQPKQLQRSGRPERRTCSF